MTANLLIRPATAKEDCLIAQHFFQLWRDNNVSESSLEPNWQKTTQEFIDRARASLNFQGFVAERDREIVGSVSCQLFAGLYPLIITKECRKYGYIWNGYVEPEHRKRGIGGALTQRACNYLKSIGCTKAILHASPYGKPLYSQLGFVESNEMCLDLTEN